MITIIDYGLGNIAAFLNIYRRLNIEARLAGTAAELDGARKVILPGVGHFDHAMRRLDESGMREALERLVREEGIPVLGVCVGMQMLAEASDEGSLPGLGWIDGRVRALSSMDQTSALPLPHMGWNDVRPTTGGGLFEDIDEEDARFYFLHSYYLDCDRQDDVLAVSQYGVEFACAVRSNNVFGVQFHPEKSHHCGARFLKRFAEL